jgi:hypothetical protein
VIFPLIVPSFPFDGGGGAPAVVGPPLLSFASSSPPLLQLDAIESKLIMAINPSHNRTLLLNIN